MKAKPWIFFVGTVMMLSAAGYGYLRFFGDQPTSQAGGCETHSVVQCPFCSPELLESMGFCRGHGVPEAVCTRCRDDLEEAFRAEGDWCQGHGLPESHCELCNPGILERWKPKAEPVSASDPCAKHTVLSCPFCFPELLESMGFCRGHGVPEAVCTRCRDDLEEAFRTEGDWCQGHGLPESHCELCNPGTLQRWAEFESSEASSTASSPHSSEEGIEVSIQSVPRIHRQPALSCATEQSLIRLSQPDMAQKAGLDFAPVEVSKLRRTLEAPAEVKYDARRHARLGPRAPGIISEVRCDLGQEVGPGEVVAVVDSAALGTAKSALLQAEAQVQLWERNSAQEKVLLNKQLSTQREALEAETRLVESRIALQAAQQKLRNLGLTEEQIQQVQERSDTSSLLYLTAPFAGVVVELSAVVGERADENSPVLSLADTSKMWAMLDVDAAAIRHVAKGQAVLLVLDGQEDQTFGGIVTWISTQVDPRTRTIKVRAEIDNADGWLRARGFGTARIVTRDDGEAIMIPKSAVQWEGCCNVAFVRRNETEFVPRKLLLGYDAGEYYEVSRGLNGGELVVTQGSFLLKTELKKESIGAGCCDVDYLSQE
ncbi:MAG: efflux RND transporter periplasmic adaptor subunit [Planctomycetota bacterium]|nr:MAG: efflux RND transporter periplasmic adaptor subunit [Planctomycetota bacterium]